MISGLCLTVVLSVLSLATATPSQTSSSGPISATLNNHHHHHHSSSNNNNNNNISTGAGSAFGGGGGGVAPAAPNPVGPLSSVPRTWSLAAAGAIQSVAHDLKDSNKEAEKLGEKINSELGEVIAAAAGAERRDAADALIARPSLASLRAERQQQQQVNISGAEQRQSGARGQPASWRTLDGGLQARAHWQNQAPAIGEEGGGGGVGADEKVSQPVEHNHDARQRRRRHNQETSNSEQQQQQVIRASAEQSLSSATNSNTDKRPAQASEANRARGPVVYTNQFVLEVQGGEEEARKLAQKHGFVYLNHILADFYHLEHRRLSKRSLNAEQDLEDISIRDEPQVLLLERQVLKRRVKRDFIELEPPPRLGRAHSQVRPPNQARPPPLGPPQQHQQQQQQHLRPAPANGRYHAHQQQQPPTRPANQPAPAPHRLSSSSSSPLAAAHRLGSHPDWAPPPDGSSPAVDSLEVSASTPSILNLAASSSAASFNRQQGFTGPNQQRVSSLLAPPVIVGGNRTAANNNNNNNIGSNNNSSLSEAGQQQPFNDPSWPLMWYLDGGAKNGFDLNVMAAWKMGYTGKGIVITILDDGLEKDHPDLQANYDPLASFDINGDDADPMPRYDVNDSNRHGTRCAGEVAAVPDNNICSIGIAYNSKVGGVRMLDGDVTDAVEARSLALNNQHIHIYSASWGPDDNGKTVDGPGALATRAFMDGVTSGRQGLGSIFVFASGNGGREHDNCNCDGYTNSIWTLSISSATENGFVPWYIEACSSTLATTYSSGSYEERQIATTDLHHSCTSSHTGTSASAPLAAGICALVLESNPLLSWRDMQHIVVRTAKPANLVAKDWRTNAMGRNVSHAFGYGLMDAAAMILMAKQWTTMPKQYSCAIEAPPMEKLIPARGYIELKLRAQCSNVTYLEHVQSKIDLSASRRGDLHIYLVSPGGTRSTLLAQRPNDHAEQGFRNWPFMTVHNWGESPNGVWTLEVHNDGKPQSRAYFQNWTLILYGTNEDPNRQLDATGTTRPPPLEAPLAELPKQARPQPSTAPPPPISISHRPAPETANEKPAPTPSQHWSSYPSSSSQPPPPPPLRPADTYNQAEPKPKSSSPSGPASSSSSSSSTSSSVTTQATYVTTFNTIVSGSSAARGQQPSPPLTGMKADFDIVSAPSGRPQQTSGNHLVSGGPEDPPERKQTIARPSDDSEGPNITKPPIGAIDNHFLQQQHQHPLEANRPASTIATPSTTTTQHTTNGLDLEGGAGNQIDLKLTKDYRSSGDQSAANGQSRTAQTTQPGDQRQGGDQSSDRLQKSSSSSSGFSQLFSFVPPALLATLLIVHLQLDQLVRHRASIML